jgi:peptidoglycan/LPS O-acetylase OafA/YrhL
MGELKALTGLRGFAAAWVVAYHLFAVSTPRLLLIPNPLEPLAPFDVTSVLTSGWLGVHLFFALSAFLLAYPFLSAVLEDRPLPNVWDYAINRLARILPAYWVQIVILYACMAFGWWHKAAIGKILLNVFLLHTLSPQVAAAVNEVYWTLPVEFGYYLLLPLLAFALACIPKPKLRHGLIGLFITVLLVQVMRLYIIKDADSLNYAYKAFYMGQLLATLDIFVAGSVACWGYYALVKRGPIPAWLCYGLMLAGIAGLLVLGGVIHRGIATYWQASPLLRATSVIGGLSSASLILGLALAAHSQRFCLGLDSRVWQWLGSRSFSLYLWHVPVLHMLAKLMHKQNHQGDILWLMVAIGVPITLVLSELSYRFVEQPALRKKARFLKQDFYLKRTR